MTTGTLIPELGHVLSGRRLAIWEGQSGLPPAREEAYRRLWLRQAGRPVPAGRGPCLYEGGVAEPAPCNCEDRHVRWCNHDDADWDRCVRWPVAAPAGPARGRGAGSAGGGVSSCAFCPLHEPAPPPAPPPAVGSTRNLLLHVYPSRPLGTWQRALDQLKPRLGLFNGKRVCAVVTEDTLDPPDAVEEYLDGHGFEVLAVPNDCTLREVATWGHLWDRVPVGAEGVGHATFYCHAKAVTRPVNPGVSCHLWAWILWHVMLDYWPLVLHELRDHGRPLAGCFKKLGNGFPGSRSAWHYSGSFFWVRNDLVARDQLAGVDRQWWGNESWPGSHFPPSAAGNLFHEGFVNHQGPRVLDLYDFAYLVNTVTPELDFWKVERAEHLTFWGANANRVVYRAVPALGG